MSVDVRGAFRAMTLLRRLILTFTVLAFLPLVVMAAVLLGSQRRRLMEAGRERVQSLAASTAGRVDLLLERTVEQVEQFALSRALAAELDAANQAYERMAEGDIERMLLSRDREWLEAGDPLDSRIIQESLSNRAAGQLRLFQSSAPERYAEIMLTDRAGGLLAATNPTSDYYQRDEEWWQRAFAGGQGSTFVEEIGYDESAGVFTLDLAAAVRNEAGEVAGILKISHDVNVLFEIIRELKPGKSGAGHLVNAEGETVFAAERPESVRFGSAEMRKVHSRASGVFAGRIAGGEQKQVIGHAILRSTCPAGKARMNDSPWFVVVTQAAPEVYAPYRRAFTWTAIMFAVPLAGLILLAAYLRKSLVEPIEALHWASERIAEGKLDVRVQIGQGDELEEVGHEFNRMAGALQRHEEDQRLELRRRAEELRQTDMQARRVREAMSAEMNSISEGMREALEKMRQAFEQGFGVPGNVDVAADAWATVRAFAEDLQDVCKVEGGRMSLELAEVRLDAILGSALRVLAPLIERYGVEVKLPEDSAEWLVVADGPKLKQIVYAVLSNAMKYGGKGSAVTVSVRRDEGATIIGVRDEGPGISPERQPTIFDPLIEPGARPGSPEESIGLSLSVAKQLVERHGGRIWVASRPGSGSTFYFSLPDREPPSQEGSADRG